MLLLHIMLWYLESGGFSHHFSTHAFIFPHSPSLKHPHVLRFLVHHDVKQYPRRAATATAALPPLHCHCHCCRCAAATPKAALSPSCGRRHQAGRCPHAAPQALREQGVRNFLCLSGMLKRGISLG